MKAVIPAAGLGTRFLPATKAQPKEMLPVVDRPVIQFVVEEAVAAGITDILIVTGRGKRAIEDHFDRAFELETLLDADGNCDALEDLDKIANLADIHYIRQKHPKGLGHAVLCGEQHVGDKPFLVMLGDVIVPSNDCIPKLIDVYHEKGHCSVIAVERVEPDAVHRYGIIAGTDLGDGLWKVEDLVEKPKPEDAPSNLAIFGRYLLTPDVFRQLRRAEPSIGGEIQLTDSLKAMLAHEDMYAVELQTERYDIGNPLSWMEANIALGLQDPEMCEPLKEHIRKIIHG